jgi:hypothetical protein
MSTTLKFPGTNKSYYDKLKQTDSTKMDKSLEYRGGKAKRTEVFDTTEFANTSVPIACVYAILADKV